jgi:hypothetical protein
MSRSYGMTITIKDARPEHHETIRTAIEEAWAVDDWLVTGDEILVMGDSSLGGGETEEEFADRVSAAIWRENEGFCLVVVNAVYMEVLPYESYCRDEDDYARLMDKAEPSLDDGHLADDSAAAIAIVDTKPQSSEFAYRLSLDGDLFRRQRELLLRLASAASEGRPLETTTKDAEHLEGLIGLCDSLADQAHDRNGIDCLLTNDGDKDNGCSATRERTPTAADVESELKRVGVTLAEDVLEVSEQEETEAEEPLDVEKLACVKINAPHWFKRPDFRVWLNQNEMERARDRLATWHTGGEPRENSDTFITYNGGEVSDYQDLPEDVLECDRRGLSRARR